jgi:hypothetical protein
MRLRAGPLACKNFVRRFELSSRLSVILRGAGGIAVSCGIVGPAGADRPPDRHVPTDPQQASGCRELSEQEIVSLVRDIDRNGYGVLAQYVSPADMDVLRYFI